MVERAVTYIDPQHFLATTAEWAKSISTMHDPRRHDITGQPQKDEILEGAAFALLAEPPTSQVCILRTLILTLAKESDPIDGRSKEEPEVTNRRDFAFAILAHEAVAPLLTTYSNRILEAYLEALLLQSDKNDPFSGSISTLLDAGIIIAPHVRTQELKTAVLEAWSTVPGKFSPESDSTYIFSRLEGIESRMPSDTGYKSKLLTNGPIEQLDRDVEALRNQTLERLSNKQVAELLGVSLRDIDESVRRLIADGRIKPYERHAQNLTASAELDNQVVRLRIQGLTRSQIVTRLQRSLSVVDKSIRRLIREGRVEAAPKGRPVDHARIQFDANIEKLRNENLRLTNKEIAFQLGMRLQEVENAAKRLIRQGRITPRKKGRRKK